MVRLVLLACLLVTTEAFANEQTSIVLHAVDNIASCEAWKADGICAETGPTTDITNFDLMLAFILLRNYEDVSGVNCGFDFPLEWGFVAQFDTCLPDACIVDIPRVVGPGPDQGHFFMCFGAVTGGSTIEVGRLLFLSVGAGCLDIIEPSYGGVQVLDGAGVETPVHPANWGRICHGPGGRNTCDSAATPVLPTSWARLKSQYRQ